MSSTLVAMSPTIVALFLFTAVVFAAGAILLSVQDLVTARANARNKDAPFRLQRLPKADPKATGPIARFDVWFLRMIKDTGLSVAPASAALMML